MKFTTERVSSILNRRSQDERLLFDPGRVGGATAVFPPPHGGTMAGGSPEMQILTYTSLQVMRIVPNEREASCDLT
jgi:hypothetical protein